MKKRITIAIFAAFIVLSLFVHFRISQKESSSNNSITVMNQTGNNIGQVAPNFTLKSIDGQIVRLSDFKGQKILLNFWASWCPPCKSEIPDLNEFYLKNKKQDISVLSVNMTYAEKNIKTVKAFQDMYKIKYPIALDQTGDISALYGILTIPTSYFIDSNGLIHNRIIGPLQEDTIKKLIEAMD